MKIYSNEFGHAIKMAAMLGWLVVLGLTAL